MKSECIPRQSIVYVSVLLDLKNLSMTSRKPSVPSITCSFSVFSDNLFSSGDMSIRVSGGTPQLRMSHASIRQVFLDNISEDELLFSSQQSSPHSGECFFNQGFEAIPRDQVFNESDFRLFPRSIPGTNYGRLRFRLEWNNW